MIQLDLFGDGISDVYVKAHGLKHSKKLHKKCGKCPEMIPNKPSSRYCSDCTIDEYLGQKIIKEFTEVEIIV